MTETQIILAVAVFVVLAVALWVFYVVKLVMNEEDKKEKVEMYRRRVAERMASQSAKHKSRTKEYDEIRSAVTQELQKKMEEDAPPPPDNKGG